MESISSSWNPPHCCQICSVVVQSVSVFLPCHRRTCFAVVEPTLLLSNLGGGWKLFRCLLWWSGIRYRTGQWDGSYKGIAKMSHDKRHGSCFGTYFMGLPFPGSPLMFPPSLVPFPGSFVGRGWATHISLEKGEAVAAVMASIVIPAHIPHKRGRASLRVAACIRESVVVVRAWVVVVEWERRAVELTLTLMSSSNSAPTSKIVADIYIQCPDNEITSCISLWIF